MKKYSDMIEFVVSFLILTTLSFTLMFCGFNIVATTLQLCIIVAAVGDIALFLLYWEDVR